MNGLNIVLHIAQIESYYAFSNSVGAHVRVHNKTVVPSFLEGYLAAPNTQTNFQVGRVISSSLPHPYSDCIDDPASYDSVFTRAFASNNITYRQKDCYNYCYQRRVVDNCHCYDPSFSMMTFNSQACSNFSQFYCIGKTFDTFFALYAATNCTADCPKECESIDYPITMTFASFPVKYYYMQMLADNDPLAMRYFNMTGTQALTAIKSGRLSLDTVAEVLDGRTLMLNVYYDDLVYTSIEEAPKMELVDLISASGGTLGLFIGSSFLSFFELFDLFYQLFVLMLESVFFTLGIRRKSKITNNEVKSEPMLIETK